MKPWPKEETDLLLKLVDEGKTPGEVSILMSKTKGQIFNKLLRLGKSFGKKWSKDELNTVKKYCPHEIEEAVKQLNRSKRAVKAKALELGLRGASKRPWTEEEEKSLKGAFSNCSINNLSEMFGRSPTAVQSKASKLGLKSCSWAKDEQKLKELYDERVPFKDIAKVIGRSVASIKGRISHLGIRRKRSIKEVISVIDDRNVLSTCIKHGETRHHVLKSSRLVCSECREASYKKRYVRKTSVEYRVSLDSAMKFFSGLGYLVNSDAYVNTNGRLEAVCPASHPCTISYTGLQQGHGCSKCAGLVRAANSRLQAEIFYVKLVNKAGEDGYEVMCSLEEYKDSHTKITFKCPQKHLTEIAPYSFMNNHHRCGVCCSSGVSLGETQVFDFISSMYKGEVLNNVRDLISPYEVDIFIPRAKIAIEYNGLYWHSNDLIGKKDFTKFKLLKNEGIRYIGIFEDEWLLNRRKVEVFLRVLLNNREPKVRVRPQKVYISKINHKKACSFLDDYHYLGGRAAKHSVGMEYEGKLAAVIQLSSTSRQSKFDLEIVRMCVHPDFYIHGLWSFCRKHVLDKFFLGQSIVSFSDNRLHTGEVYKHMGLSFDGFVAPDYYWCKGGKRFNKSSLRKTEEEKRTGLTEHQLRTSQGYFKVYDVGKTRWALFL